MQCLICKTGEVKDGVTTVTLQRGETTMIIKSVPANVCGQCGEYYLGDVITGKMLAMAEAAVAKGAEVEVLRWAP